MNLSLKGFGSNLLLTRLSSNKHKSDGARLRHPTSSPGAVNALHEITRQNGWDKSLISVTHKATIGLSSRVLLRRMAKPGLQVATRNAHRDGSTRRSQT